MIRTVKQPHPSDTLHRTRARILETAQREGWGPLVGEVVLGRDLHLTFANGERAVVPLPQ